MKLRKYLPEFIVLVYAILFLCTKNPSNQWDRVIVSDGKGYYAYLTALFIYHDTDYGFINKYESEYYPASGQLYKDFRYDTGNGIVNKYFPGPAILWLPFFGLGHATALLFDLPADGYSLPYQLTIALAAFFYLWLALVLLRRILRFYTANENAVAWSLAATALATNLVYYTINAGSQVHVYNFFLINAFIYSIIKVCKQGKPVYYAAAAFMLGMIIISRPQNGIIVLTLPFLCGNMDSFRQLLKNIFINTRNFLLSLVAFAIPLLVPLTYWYLKTGNLLIYSYGNEAYDLTKPHLISFLFSFEKGWLLYTPVAAFALLGFAYLFRKNKWQFVSLSAFLFFLVYFMSSWWVWTYTSYISQRVMIDFYAFTAILLIFTFKWFEKFQKRIILPVLLSGFIALNLMQHIQQLIWIYPAGPVTARTYFSNFFSFSKGTTFMIPEKEIKGKQVFISDFESENPFLKSGGLTFSDTTHAGKKALVIQEASVGKPLFFRGMSDYKEINPVIVKLGGWYNPGSDDSSLLIEVNIGNYKGKYSTSIHNLMPGLKTGKWKYAEMAVYLPYLRSVSDSLFVTFRNLCKGRVLVDDFSVEFLKMQGPERHDWILPADDPVDSAIIYKTDLETMPEAPWGNPASVATEQSFSGKKSSRIQVSSPYSVVFEKELDTSGKNDGYFRVSSRIAGDSLAEVLLVFDFSENGKTVFYKTYPVKTTGNQSVWTYSEIFREIPVSSLKAGRVKIYYWYLKGNNPVYIDDMQVDIVNYKPAKNINRLPFITAENSITLHQVCCDFEKQCLPESGHQVELPVAFSGKRVCEINALHPFSYSHLLPLNALKNRSGNFIVITAKVNSDQYSTSATLVADFRHQGRSASYNPAYLRKQTIKGEWNTINFGLNVPEGITASDSVLVYFYLPKNDEVMMIDDFCVSIKNRKPILSGKEK